MRTLILITAASLLLAGCYDPVRITVVNGLGSWSVERIYISGTDEEEWGLSSLSSNMILAPGDSVAIAVEPGEYDISIVDEDGDTYTRWDQTVTEEGYRWQVTLDDID